MTKYSLFIAIQLLVISWGFAQSRYYVDARNQNATTGLTWSTAFRDLATAIAAVPSGSELWVAAGIYRTQDVEGVIIQKSLRLFGGWAGTESSPTQRNFVSNPTILDGTLSNGSLARHILQVSNPNGNVLIDGFIFQNASATLPTITNSSPRSDLNGGGIYIESTTLPVPNTVVHIRNCVFQNLSAARNGAGIFAIDEGLGNMAVRVENCDFLNNAVANYFFPNDNNGGAHVQLEDIRNSEISESRFGSLSNGNFAVKAITQSRQGSAIRIESCEFFNASWNAISCDFRLSAGLDIRNNSFRQIRTPMQISDFSKNSVISIRDNRFSECRNLSFYLLLIGGNNLPAESRGSLQIVGNSFEGNEFRSLFYIYFDYPNYLIENNRFCRNTSESFFYLNNPRENFHLPDLEHRFEIRQNLFANNSMRLLTGRIEQMFRGLIFSVNQNTFIDNVLPTQAMINTPRHNEWILVEGTLPANVPAPNFLWNRNVLETPSFTHRNLISASNLNIQMVQNVFSDAIISQRIVNLPAFSKQIEEVYIQTKNYLQTGDCSFSLLPCSRAVNRPLPPGMASSLLATDLAGDSRIQDDLPDLGAYESKRDIDFSLLIDSCDTQSGSVLFNTFGVAPNTYTWSNGPQAGVNLVGLEPGDYTFFIKDATECEIRVPLRIPAVIDLAELFGDTLIQLCSSETERRITLPTGDYSWKWSDGDFPRSRGFSTSGLYSLEISDACSTYETGVRVDRIVPRSAKEVAIACLGNSYEWRLQNLVTDGLYFDTIKSAQACDSLLFELDLSFEEGDSRFEPIVSRTILGDSVRIILDTDIALLDNLSILPDLSSRLEGGRTLVIEPTDLSKVLLSVRDDAGCLFERQIELDIDREQQVIMSNILNPSLGGINGRLLFYSKFEIQSGDFTLFDRWGGIITQGQIEAYADRIYEAPAIANRLENLPPGVYVVFLRYQNFDEDRVFTGDFTLMK